MGEFGLVTHERAACRLATCWQQCVMCWTPPVMAPSH